MVIPSLTSEPLFLAKPVVFSDATANQSITNVVTDTGVMCRTCRPIFISEKRSNSWREPCTSLIYVEYGPSLVPPWARGDRCSMTCVRCGEKPCISHHLLTVQKHGGFMRYSAFIFQIYTFRITSKLEVLLVIGVKTMPCFEGWKNPNGYKDLIVLDNEVAITGRPDSPVKPVWAEWVEMKLHGPYQRIYGKAGC